MLYYTTTFFGLNSPNTSSKKFIVMPVSRTSLWKNHYKIMFYYF